MRQNGSFRFCLRLNCIIEIKKIDANRPLKDALDTPVSTFQGLCEEHHLALKGSVTKPVFFFSLKIPPSFTLTNLIPPASLGECRVAGCLDSVLLVRCLSEGSNVRIVDTMLHFGEAKIQEGTQVISC